MTSSEDLFRWDNAAEVYARTVGGDDDSFYRRLAPFLRHQFGDVTGLSILDLGCGHGWLTALLRQAGAHVVGVDGSTALIDIARSRYPGIDFQTHDLTAGLPSPPRTYDRIVSHMVLMDIPVLDRLLADVTSALSRDGVFVFSILHPCFFDQAPVQDADTGQWHRHVRGYLEHEQRWIASFGGHTHYHRPLSWYVDRLAAHGLAVTGLHEPATLPAHRRPATQWSDYERWFATIPTMIALACRPLFQQTRNGTRSGVRE
ncbi:methyltransferase domain-containing protein [Frankia sp. AgB32]|uniref:class I SAM-dependent DNA methyltransferase n=1 Tax=Frankia sp. AgB32 TaxID=631119 RepID=UPI00200D8620|nr:methyltransferase domain-containing protein [Frankia sp. AgB32]MCK9897705.1 methyltransferase domain-containing protein [Frankia sp. AgB32]